MPVAAVVFDIHLPDSTSLKDKRMVVRHLLDVARRRFLVSAAEVEHHDLRQRAGLGFAVVASDHHHLDEVLDSVERFVWSHPGVDVLDTERSYLEIEA